MATSFLLLRRMALFECFWCSWVQTRLGVAGLTVLNDR
jgi:hypothetical protein